MHPATINLQKYRNLKKSIYKLQKKYSKTVDIGSYPFFRLGRVGVSVVVRSTNKKLIKKCSIELLKTVKQNNIKTHLL